MKLEWDGRVGPAAIIAAFGSLSVLISLGVIYGTMTSDIRQTQKDTLDQKIITDKMNRHALERDAHVAQQAERLGKIETSLSFIVPTLERIEAQLARRPNP